MEPRISIVTLGVDDLDRAIRFYEAMGLERNEKITEGVAFFQMGGMILALWPREELAKDAGIEYRRPGAPTGPADPGPAVSAAPGFSGIALAYNKPAGHAFFGGMQGYFEDTEGNLWEVAYNPGFPIDAEGRISLPE
jgi:uncharacterized protein